MECENKEPEIVLMYRKIGPGDHRVNSSLLNAR